MTEQEIEEGRSDTQAFQQLLLTGMSAELQSEFVQKCSLRALTEFSPRIMNHGTLLRRQYDPFDITDTLRKEASSEHKQLFNAFKRAVDSPEVEALRHALLKKAAQLLFIVRSNIAHSEKTPRGPDLEKARRDQDVSLVTAMVMDDLLDILFDHPHRRLAVYGTLAPGRSNDHMLSQLDGQWLDGHVRGEVQERDGFPVFSWRNGPSVPVRILDAPALSQTFERLDQFEGAKYRRILVPVQVKDQRVICNIYEGTEAGWQSSSSMAGNRPLLV